MNVSGNNGESECSNEQNSWRKCGNWWNDFNKFWLVEVTKVKREVILKKKKDNRKKRNKNKRVKKGIWIEKK